MPLNSDKRGKAMENEITDIEDDLYHIEYDDHHRNTTNRELQLKVLILIVKILLFIARRLRQEEQTQ